MNVKIETGIPIAKRASSAGADIVELFNKMKPGDSFKIAATKCGRIFSVCKAKNIKITTQLLDEMDTEAGVRVTRVWKL